MNSQFKERLGIDKKKPKTKKDKTHKNNGVLPDYKIICECLEAFKSYEDFKVHSQEEHIP